MYCLSVAHRMFMSPIQMRYLIAYLVNHFLQVAQDINVNIRMIEEERCRITSEIGIFNVSQVLQHLLYDPRDKKDENEQEQPARPSEYTRQMLMTTEEKSEYILKSCYKRSMPGLWKSPRSEDLNFEVTPRMIIFQRFTPGHAFNASVTLRNTTQVSQYLKICYERNPFFSVEHRGSSYTMMLAPGLSNTYNVKFVPEEKKDYEYRLKFATNSGELVVPVIAIGPRGILDFPDQIEIPTTAVKVASSKALFVRNVGDAPAIFVLYSSNSRFWIEPNKGSIDAGESLQLSAYFLSNESGDFEGILYLEYETGEKLGIHVRCSAQNCPVRIDRSSIRMEETYLGLSRSKVVTIHNRSDYIVKYKWMLLKDATTDDQQKKEYKRLFHLVYETELTRCVNLVHYNVCTPDVHQLVYQRIYADEIESLSKETFQYNHMCFMLTPQEGEILPKSSTDVTVLFRALEVGEVTSTAYLEITGREDRLPLSLHGIGRGPFFRLNVITIDCGNLYSTSVNNYEHRFDQLQLQILRANRALFQVIAANKGHIPGTLIYQAKLSDFGGRIEVTPSSLFLKPDQHKSFNLCFSSNRTGEFVERIDFVVKESLEILCLHVKQTNNVSFLFLDHVSLLSNQSFSSRQEAHLHNLSLVPVAFSMSVFDDGDQAPLVCDEFAKARTKPSFPTHPREFFVCPEEGVISAQSFIKVKIIYTANIARVGRTVLCVHLWDTDSDPTTLSIKFCGQVATLLTRPCEINLGSCFINFPYTSSFRLENASEIDGYFCFLPQSISEDAPLVYSLSTYQGLIKATHSKTIQLTIIGKVLGLQKVTLSMLTMGERSPKVCCIITCLWQGPVVYVEPTILDFGQVQVLEEKSMDLLLTNDSPTTARFTVAFEKDKLPLTITQESGDLKAHESVKLVIKLYLRDVGKCKGNITIHIVNGSIISLDLMAIGIGCSVVFEPQIFPIYDLGLVFSHQMIKQTITLKNYGTRQYQIFWSTMPEIELHRGRIVLPKTLKFQIEPLVVEVPAEGTNVVECKLLSHKIDECVQQVWYVFGQIERMGKRHLIGTSTFTVCLTKPQILFNKTELMFRIDVCPEGDKVQHIDELSITNKSKLDLDANLSVSSPFSLLTAEDERVQSMKILLIDGESTNIRVIFYIDDEISHLYSQSYVNVLRLVYDQHPHQNKIICKAFLNFPNLLLDCTDFVIDCELGLSIDKILTLTNDGPVPVSYKFAWVGDSIEMERESNIDRRCRSHFPCNHQKIDTCDGRDEPTHSTSALKNSSLSEASTQEHESEITVREESTDNSVDSNEMRNRFNQLVSRHFEECTELPALEMLSTEPRLNSALNEVLKIVPNEGTVLPYTTQRIYIQFHAFERLRVKATMVCDIFRGPFEKVNILARADSIRFKVDTSIIDFGEQLFLEPCQKNFTLTNCCGIAFQYKITDLSSDQRNDAFHINPFKVEPMSGTVNVESLVQFNVEHRPTILGTIDRRLNLEVNPFLSSLVLMGDSESITIVVKAFATFPQVYPYISCEISHRQYLSVEMEYSAIQSLTTEFIIKTVPENSSSARNDLFSDDIECLTAEEWSIISYDEVFPRSIDIAMAMERYLAKLFVESNSYVAMQYGATAQKEPIPRLFSSEYVVDMKSVIIDHVSQYSTSLINYGPWNVEIRMRKPRKKKALAKLGILVHFKAHTNLKVGDSAVFRVTWQPSRETFTERCTTVKHSVYIEVIHGCTIPITIKGTVTYPFLTVNPTLLDFQRVVVGECLVLSILIQNEGLVNCNWEAKLSPSGKKRQDECPFYVQPDFSLCSPGQTQVVRVCFKPRTSVHEKTVLLVTFLQCHVQAKLEISVKMGLETQVVSLTAYGIEPKLNIVEPTVRFPAVVPFTEIQEEIFTVENASDYPIELFWRHLDDRFQIEDRVVDSLLRYYQVNEILLPPRKPGDPMPSSFVEFYNDLVNEGARACSLDSFDEGLLQSSDNPQKTSKRGRIIFSVQDYSEKLGCGPDLPGKSRDPVREYFESVKKKAISNENLLDPTMPEKKVCIIFHGAPFTEYQETACKSGRVLGVPVLSIDKAITEAIALGDSLCSLKLRQIVDDAYQNYMEVFQRHKCEPDREISDMESHTVDGSTAREKSIKTKGSSKRGRKIETQTFSDVEESSKHPQTEITLSLGDRLDPVKDLEKVPPIDKLHSLDPLSRYEYKLQAILNLEKIIGPYETILSISQKEKVSKKKETPFLGISPEILAEALQQRLSDNNFNRGFVVQSLDSNLLRNSAAEILVLLLRIVGHAAYFLFVTFINSMADYNRKIEQLRQEYGKRISSPLLKKLSMFELLLYFNTSEVNLVEKNSPLHDPYSMNFFRDLSWLDIQARTLPCRMRPRDPDPQKLNLVEKNSPLHDSPRNRGWFLPGSFLTSDDFGTLPCRTRPWRVLCDFFSPKYQSLNKKRTCSPWTRHLYFNTPRLNLVEKNAPLHDPPRKGGHSMNFFGSIFCWNIKVGTLPCRTRPWQVLCDFFSPRYRMVQSLKKWSTFELLYRGQKKSWGREPERKIDRDGKIRAIDEMSLSEYDLLNEEDKMMFLEAILPGKRERATLRRARFAERIISRRKGKGIILTLQQIRGRVANSKSAKGKGSVKSSKRERSNKKPASSRPVSSKRETTSKPTRSRDGSKREQRQEAVPGEIKQVSVAMDRYYTDLSAIESVINNWDPVKKTVVYISSRSLQCVEISNVARSKVPRSAKSKDVGSLDTGLEMDASKFYVWYVKASDPWQDVMYDMIVAQMSQNHLAKSALRKLQSFICALPVETPPEPDLRSRLYTVLTSSNSENQNKLVPRSSCKSDKIHAYLDVYQLLSLTSTPTLESILPVNEPTPADELNTLESRVEDRRKNKKRRRRASTIADEQTSAGKVEDRSWIPSASESKHTVSETSLEEPPRPRWILSPNQSQTFKIRFQPEATGVYEETYLLTTVGGNNITYEVNVSGVADIPTLDMNPSTIFTKVTSGQLDDASPPAYFLDSGIYNFGPILVLGSDKRPHCREAQFRFCNISKVHAEVFFFLSEDEIRHFNIQPEKLAIPVRYYWSYEKTWGMRTAVFISYCNETWDHLRIRLQSEGTKLDIQLDRKQLSFGRTLLYRTDSQILTIQSGTALPVFWRMQVEESAEPKITYAPDRGTINPWGQQRIEFQHHGTEVGVIDRKPITFQVFVQEEDEEPIFTELILVSAETYDVAIRIDHANPIDLKCIKVNVPVNAAFTIRNLGEYEVKYEHDKAKNFFRVTSEDNEILAKLRAPANLKDSLVIQPISGSIPPNSERIARMTFVARSEIVLKEAAILRCHLVDAKNEAIIIAEIPLTVSLAAYCARYNINPYPVMDFGSLAVCTEKTMHLSIENTGKFPFHYSIYVQDRHPSVMYMTYDTLGKNQSSKGKSSKSKKGKNPGKSGKADTELMVGPMTITKREGEVDVGQTDNIAIHCYAEFVGSQEEQITFLVDDNSVETKEENLITLCVHSSVPWVDFQNLDSIFQENWLTDRIEDFDSSKKVGPYTVFARQEKCLYFRYVIVSNTHVTRFKLYNRNIVAANVDMFLRWESLTSETIKSDTFLVEPRNECIPPMSYKVFTLSFTPTTIQTYEAILDAVVALPPHLEDERLSIKLVGESCVPEVAIVQPVHGKREPAVLNFRRTLINETTSEQFALENSGFIKAKIIVEIHEDQNEVFAISTPPESRSFLQTLATECDEESNGRCTIVALMPGDLAYFNVTFSPIEVGNCTGKIRLFVVDNPYENLTINLEAESYMETIVLEGLEMEDSKHKVRNESRDSIHKGRRFSSKQNSLASMSTRSVYATSLTYILDYGLRFVGRMYKKTFKVANKSTDRWYRFQWSVHPNIVFIPSMGHVKYLTYKEIVATFLAAEPTDHINTCIECVICEIELADSTTDKAWDDRQMEVRWERMHPDVVSQPQDAELMSRKMVGPSAEPKYQIVPGTGKCIQVLLSVTVAFSEYACPVREIYFKDTLMFQTREYKFSLSNPGVVDTVYAWKITMDEQYPKKQMENGQNFTPRPRTPDDIAPRSRPNSRSFKGTAFSSTSELRRSNFDRDGRSDPNSTNFSRRCVSSISDTFEVRPSSSARPSSDLFSSTAGLSQRTTDSWLESDDLPFSIYPETGTILPQQSIECTLKFSPMDVFYYKAYLTCRVENMNPNLPDLIIPIVARSLLPYCHFDVQESDYVTSGRRDPKRPGPIGQETVDDPALWHNLRVIEFKVIGVGETHVKKFHLINPTAEDYRFSWRDRTPRLADEISKFQCTVLEGIAESGKRIELAFTFLAEDTGIFESFWLFSIERYNLRSLFLLVGNVTEPSVHCLTIHARLKPTTLGLNVRDSVKLLNDEDFHIPFKVVEESLFSEGKYQKIAVNPMTGILSPKSQQLLWVEYHPTRVGEFQFSIQCAVKLMKSPLTVFVAASVYEIASSVSYCKATGESVRVDEKKEHVIDLGKVTLHVPISVKFDVTNIGKVAFYYTWELGMTPEIACRNAYRIAMAQKQGHVIAESQSTCCLTLTTFRKTVIKDHRFALKISNGPTYRFLLRAFSSKPAIEFSFDRYDFGPCYIHENSAVSYYAQLSLTNKENVPFIIECKYEDQPHLLVNLNSISEALTAGSTITIPIVFRPLKEKKYREQLAFTIDSVNEKKVTITGEGIIYKVRLANPRDKSIDLGSVMAFQTVSKRIPVVNEGLAPVELEFNLLKNFSDYKDYGDPLRPCTIEETEQEEKDEYLAQASVMETKRSWTQDNTLATGEPNLSDVLRIEPSSKVVLRPGKTINVLVRFKPTARMSEFTSKVAFRTSSMILPLFVVRGRCVGPQFRLNRTHLSFGTLVQGCAEEAKLVLMNTGDVGARFKWNSSRLPVDFKINPTSGYCSPGMDINFVVTFQPSQKCGSIAGEIIIDIENYGSLSTKVSGGCAKLPEPIETILFECVVRQRQSQSVLIANNSNIPWKLTPQITGDYFFTQKVLYVPAQGFASCLITYAPVAINTEDTMHTVHLIFIVISNHQQRGTLLLKTPNEGTNLLLYALRGRSMVPNVAAKIERQFPAKTKYTELLPVHNWLDRQQRFQCEIAHVTNDREQSEIPLFRFVGNNKIDVPADSVRDYRAVFYSYEKSTFHFKVTFTSEDNQHQFYEIEYNVTEPEVIESIKLTTSVRSQACHAIKLENPLDRDSIIYTAECHHPFVTIRQLPKTVSPMSHDYIHVQYHPILPSEESVVGLDITCHQLGRFPYELRLKATPAFPEKVTRVNAPLGAICKFSLTLRNHINQVAKFTIQVDNDCFTTSRSIQVSELSDGVINVVYEPYSLENVAATLTASSAIAGDFEFPLIGTCSLPKPMGPYIIKQKSSTSIPFRNVFKETKTFNFLVDIPETFTIETPSLTLNSKQAIDIKVRLLDNNHREQNSIEETYPVTGKLLVYCVDHSLSHINWVYYLRGIFE
ncbi:hydrocephalus-inducing protein-like [Calliopsis andreniformis]|uniref:hydrocephalus-inducing protein-like n=1 Tax=Calliopsis andreniformis TaxID=337506 RepID=UPI003FCE3861